MLFYYRALGASRDWTESQPHEWAGKKWDHRESETGKSLKSVQRLLLLRAGIWTFISRSQAKSMDYAYKCQLEM